MRHVWTIVLASMAVVAIVSLTWHYSELHALRKEFSRIEASERAGIARIEAYLDALPAASTTEGSALEPTHD